MLLHGAFGTIDLWGPILATLAEDHQVIAVELQGHGHTADIDRPFSYEQMADDVAALMEHLGIAQADVVGYSMGANTALQLAIRHPGAGAQAGGHLAATTAPTATTRSSWPASRQMTPEIFAGTPIEDAYLRNAPNPEDFPALVEKIKAFVARSLPGRRRRSARSRRRRS